MSVSHSSLTVIHYWLINGMIIISTLKNYCAWLWSHLCRTVRTNCRQNNYFV